MNEWKCNESKGKKRESEMENRRGLVRENFWDKINAA
jgi:hypothetical protein